MIIRHAVEYITVQISVVTLKDALHLGSYIIIIGRPITAAKDPAYAAELILKEINE